jgi:hypothetical protein
MPPNTVYVGRPTTWGNMFPLSAFSRDEAVARHAVFSRAMAASFPKVFEALRGKNLACWCSLDQPCHADVLLELANS